MYVASYLYLSVTGGHDCSTQSNLYMKYEKDVALLIGVVKGEHRFQKKCKGFLIFVLQIKWTMFVNILNKRSKF